LEDRWARLEEIVRRVVREELSTWSPQKNKTKIGFVNGRFTGLGEQELSALRDAFPAVDLQKELREMTAWILMNPTVSPRSNYSQFIHRWLGKHQAQASIRSIPTRSDVESDWRKKNCRYCARLCVGIVNGIPYCSAHSLDAMDQKPVKAA
jgi:hypothetical protein